VKILPLAILADTVLIFTSACNRTDAQSKSDPATAASDRSDVDVATALVTTRPVAQTLTLSSELVPFQEIDVYAKVAGYVKTLSVDYGAHVRKDQVMAVLEVPELQAQLDEDNAAIKAQQDQVTRAKSDVDRAKAQHNVAHLQYQRLDGVSKTQKGLVAQQEIDDAQGKDLAAESTVAAAQGEEQVAESQLAVAKARLTHDQALYDYSKITAPFDGVVTQRYANFGALMQAGTSSTQSTPLVRLSDENTLRLVIPVPESDVQYIHIGDPVDVRIPSVNKTVRGKVARFSVDVNGNTRTMHTEVDVPNADGKLVPGTYAEADITLGRNSAAVVVPQQALDRSGDTASVLVVNQDNKIEKRTVALGIQMPDYVEATSGVAKGDRVVVSDRSALKAGEIVTPKQVQQIAYGASGEQ
jgi:RND family efflux transporter MFP subunit